MHKKILGLLIVLPVLLVQLCSHTTLSGGSDNRISRRWAYCAMQMDPGGPNVRGDVRLAGSNPSPSTTVPVLWRRLSRIQRGAYSFNKGAPRLCLYYGLLAADPAQRSFGTFVVAHDSTVVPTTTPAPVRIDYAQG